MNFIQGAIALLLAAAMALGCSHQPPATTGGQKCPAAAPFKQSPAGASEQIRDPSVSRIGDVSQFFPQLQSCDEPCPAPAIRLKTDNGCACAVSVSAHQEPLASPLPERNKWYFARASEVIAKEDDPLVVCHSSMPRPTYSCAEFGTRYVLGLGMRLGHAPIASVFGQFAVRVSDHQDYTRTPVNVPFKMPDTGTLLGVFIDDPFSQPSDDPSKPKSAFVIWRVLSESGAPPAPAAQVPAHQK